MSSEASSSVNGHCPDGSSWEAHLNDARNGSRESQAWLLGAVRPYLLALAEDQLASDLRTKLAASDVVQTAMWQAWQDFGDFRGRTRAELIGWLRAVLCNIVKDGAQQYRRTAKRDLSRERSLDQIASEYGGAIDDSFTSPSEMMMASEERQRMERAMRSLSSQHEQVIRLRSDLGLSHAEIGMAINCSEDAARTLWARAIGKLGQELRRNETRDS